MIASVLAMIFAASTVVCALGWLIQKASCIALVKYLHDIPMGRATFMTPATAHEERR